MAHQQIICVILARTQLLRAFYSIDLYLILNARSSNLPTILNHQREASLGFSIFVNKLESTYVI
jgi:hypothetical protein